MLTFDVTYLPHKLHINNNFEVRKYGGAMAIEYSIIQHNNGKFTFVYAVGATEAKFASIQTSSILVVSTVTTK